MRKPRLSKLSSHERNAVTTKAGKSVPHSDPGLIEPTLPATAELNSEARVKSRRSVFRRSAVHQPKSGHGLGRSPISAEGAVPLSCFIKKRVIVTDEAADPRVPLERYKKPLGVYDRLIRKRGCGVWSFRGQSTDGRKLNFIRANCKCWDCAYCGPRRAKRYRRAIALWAEKLKLTRFLTLTLDPKKLDDEKESTEYLNKTFAKLRSVLQREYGQSITFIRVLEYQQNGMAHFHVLVDRFISIHWLKAKWQALGGGWHVDIRYVDVHRIPNYVSKYLSKDLLTSAPKGSRRVTTSRGIHLFEKPAKEMKWDLVKQTITSLRSGFGAVIAETFCETDGLLTAFSVLSNVA
jgi:hypothetical protein